MRSPILLILAAQAYRSLAFPAPTTVSTSTTAVYLSSTSSSTATSSETNPPIGIPSSTTTSSLPESTTTIHLDNATVVGTTDGDIQSFFGLPYAQPPVGDLRFEPPQAIGPYQGLIDATFWGNQCVNAYQDSSPPSWIVPAMDEYFGSLTRITKNLVFDEDCLNLNVIAPANIKPGTKLPVVAYIFFGAFFFGNSADVDGSVVVKRSIEMGEPVIFVSLNHRLGPYGFLSGKEVMSAKAGNVGLQDQRQALRWIQQYISAFGGDQNRVTLTGFSSGAVSSAYQMVAKGGDSEGLFHGVWSESGAVQSAGWLDQPPAQKAYDDFVASLSCSNATDTFACIKKAPADAVKNAGGLYNHWQPHADGEFIQSLPLQALIDGHVAQVPVVAGNSEDEGTVFTIGFPNLTTDADFESVVRSGYFPNISDKDMEKLLSLYPEDPTKGAPYNTGTQYQLAPQWKRAASFLGDVGVVSVRKRFTQTLAQLSSPVWAYYYQRDSVPALGSTHGAELSNMYGPGDMTDLLINFANYFDPNGKTKSPVHWAKYTEHNPVLLDFYGNDSLRLIPDTYREEELNFLMKLNLEEALPF